MLVPKWFLQRRDLNVGEDYWKGEEFVDPGRRGSVSVSLEHCRAIFKSRLKITRLVAELRKEATDVLPLSQKAAGRQGWPAWPGVQPRLSREGRKDQRGRLWGAREAGNLDFFM